MKALPSQDFLEKLIVRKPDDKYSYPIVIICFGASWCGPCRRLNKPALEALRPDITWFYCDIDANDYTATYCSVSGIPAFLAIIRGRPQPLVTGLSQESCAHWVMSLIA